MSYSIIDTRDFSGETVSTHKTIEAAERAWNKLTRTREWMDNQWQARELPGSRYLRIRNDVTGKWAKDEADQPLPPDAVELRDLIATGGYSQRGAAKELQISERMVRYYCAGEQRVPRVVMLAMRHLVHCPPE